METIVAIAILLISIAGPLTVAEKALTEAVSSQDQMTASYLAQDLMEYVKNVRDDNLLNNSANGWLTGLTGTFTGRTDGFDLVAGTFDLAGPPANCTFWHIFYSVEL